MTDYISRRAAIEAVDECTKLKIADDFYTVYTEDMKDMIADIPAADVRENVKGEWIVESVDLFHGEEVGESYICSVCGKDAFDKFDFCPNCGADMRGEV